MTDDPEQDSRIDGKTIERNLAASVAAGRLRVETDGRFALARGAPSAAYLQVGDIRDYDCSFLNDFLFREAYAGAAVPMGCAGCFKVKAAPRTLRGLVALRRILEQLPFHSKCGVDLANRYSRDVYAGYLYLVGLPAAQAAWHVLRDCVDSDPALGPDVPVRIKRGCSNYEAACGPSDTWTFDGVEGHEEALSPTFRRPVRQRLDYKLRRAVTLRHWIQVAYDLGDDSYLDFTDGVPLHPASVSYPTA